MNLDTHRAFDDAESEVNLCYVYVQSHSHQLCALIVCVHVCLTNHVFIARFYTVSVISSMVQSV